MEAFAYRNKEQEEYQLCHSKSPIKGIYQRTPQGICDNCEGSTQQKSKADLIINQTKKISRKISFKCGDIFSKLFSQEIVWGKIHTFESQPFTNDLIHQNCSKKQLCIILSFWGRSCAFFKNKNNKSEFVFIHDCLIHFLNTYLQLHCPKQGTYLTI